MVKHNVIGNYLNENEKKANEKCKNKIRKKINHRMAANSTHISLEYVTKINSTFF